LQKEKAFADTFLSFPLYKSWDFHIYIDHRERSESIMLQLLDNPVVIDYAFYA